MLDIDKCHNSNDVVSSPRRTPGLSWRAAVVFAFALGVMVTTTLQEHHLVRQYLKTPNDKALFSPRQFHVDPSRNTEKEPLMARNINNDAPFSIMVQLSGEMGNNLSKLASGIWVSLWLRQLYHDRPSEIRVRHQENTTKWVSAVDNLHTCVPYLADLNASEAQHQNFHWSPEQNGVGINSDDHAKIVAELLSHRGSSNATTLYSNHLSITNPYIDRYYSDFRELFAWNTTNSACCKARPVLF